MSSPVAPWLGPVAPSAERRTALTLLVVGWLVGGLGLWAHLGLPAWLAACRPLVVLEAFIGETVVPYQVDSLVRSIQETNFNCEVNFISSDEAHAEALKDERARPLLDAYGGNPFLRSLRVTLCPGSVTAFRDAAEWLRRQPGVVAVRVPETLLERLLEGEGQLGGAVEAAAFAAAVAGLLVVIGALGLLGAMTGRELERWAVLGAGTGRLWSRFLRAVTFPSLAAAVAAFALLELAGVASQYAGALPWRNLPALPPWPHEADWMLAAAGLVTGLVASFWSILPVLRQGRK